MKEITGRLFVKAENEPDTAYRDWDTLTKKEQEDISIILNRTVAETMGYTKIVETA